MKIKELYRYIALVFIVSLIQGSICAQVKYENVNKSTYVFDNSKCVVYNKNAKRAIAREIVTEGFDIQKNSIVKDVFREVLSNQRIRELKGEKLAVMFECDNKGNVENVKFIFTKTPFLTPAEINKIETILLSKKFIVKSNLSSGVGIRFSIPCFLSRIQ
ncbi:hypothetical protein [uncultured Duncaniella sp.]|uniref:hypothetical protein n=1 Tax=Muribaculum intestinale TaxID=1796646 RepID=UPI0025A97241|nr:hypothetical protein [uncultured Duncaniella sp.]